MKRMKVIAFYLPQFHRIPENDKWWGEGFTDWVSVRKAKPLFQGHNQPRIPQNNNYYNLLDKDTMVWQSELMKKYSVDGVGIYHYWFKDGRRILEKPAENLLRWKDVDMPFCFYWANQTWAKTWSKYGGNNNIWIDAEKGNQNKKNEEKILLEQSYGIEKTWKEHFEYLLPFFKDERYIKVDNRPLFLILDTEKIPCLVEMLECWRKWAVESGLNGIYVVGANCNRKKWKSLDAQLYHELSRNLGKCKVKGQGVKRFDYDELWEKILSDRFSGKTYFSGVVNYDDTPRQGQKGNVVENATPDKFSNYLTELMAKSYAAGNELVFLNAWNEWGESMYLEPDESQGEAYLQAIPYAKEHFKERIHKYIKNQNEDIDIVDSKERYNLSVLDYWMVLLENNFSPAEYLKNNNYREIAIYGYGILGKHLYSQLSGTGIDIKYVIDRRKEQLTEQNKRLHVNMDLYLPSEPLPQVDVVVVTAIYDYENVFYYLKKQGVKKIISLESILHEGASEAYIV